MRAGLKDGSLDFGQMFALGNLVEYHEHIAGDRPRLEQRHRELLDHHRELAEHNRVLTERHGALVERVDALQATIADMREGLGRIERLTARAANALEDADTQAAARKLKRRERRTFRYWRAKVRALLLPSSDADRCER